MRQIGAVFSCFYFGPYADQCSNIVTKKFYVSEGRPVLTISV